MKPEIRQYMAGFTCTSLREYQNKALAYELSVSSTEHMFGSKKQKTIGNFLGNQGNGPPGAGTSFHHPKKVLRSHEHRRSIIPAASDVRSMKLCYNCSRAGHTTKNFRSPLVSYFECGQVGHRAVHCER
ncbi:hypothetical protein OROMI_018385 [Orobanche minor]